MPAPWRIMSSRSTASLTRSKPNPTCLCCGCCATCCNSPAPSTAAAWEFAAPARSTKTDAPCVPVRSLSRTAVGKNYTTIEGLSANGDHPCQLAWIAEDVSQCGYCQAGMAMTTAALLVEKPNPTDAEIDSALSQHICRCGTYQRIRNAVHRAAAGSRQS